MKNADFLDCIREIEIELYSREFNQWVKRQSDEERKGCIRMRNEVASYRSQLETHRLQVLADKLDELAPSLTVGIKHLQKKIDETENFIATMDTLGRVIGLVSRIVTLAV